MTRHKILNIIFLIISFKFIVISLIIFAWDRTEPPFHPIRDMDHQPKIRAQSSFTEGAKSKREKDLYITEMYKRPEGTVAFGHLKADIVFYTGKLGPAADATRIAKIPVKVDDALLRRGQDRFKIYCSPCHDAVGSGKGMVPLVAGEGVFAPVPDYRSPLIMAQPDGHIFDVITNGIRTMPGYAKQIPPADRWAIVSYVKALQKTKLVKPPPPVLTPEQSAEYAKKGEAIFKSNTRICFTCHTQMAPTVKPLGPLFKGMWGREETVIVTKDGVKTEIKITVDRDYVIESIRYPLAKLVKGYMPVMPAVLEKDLSDLQIDYIIEYMKTLK